MASLFSSKILFSPQYQQASRSFPRVQNMYKIFHFLKSLPSPFQRKHCKNKTVLQRDYSPVQSGRHSVLVPSCSLPDYYVLFLCQCHILPHHSRFSQIPIGYSIATIYAGSWADYQLVCCSVWTFFRALPFTFNDRFWIARLSAQVAYCFHLVNIAWVLLTPSLLWKIMGFFAPSDTSALNC
jgi:hypothetical protein